MENVERWIGHSAMSDPGRYRSAVAELPAGVGHLNRVVQGVIIHTDWLDAYGVDASAFERVSRDTLPVAERLALVLDGDGRALVASRAPAQRSVGTCRDFALMLCAFLRCKGTAARVRCGFADYFNDGWEDHWVCEYWDRDSRCWRLGDAQLDRLLQQKRGISFDPADTPRQRFMTAGQAWKACRADKLDPTSFGHGEVKGLWFIKVNVVRDHYSINNRETSAWDSWRAAPGPKRMVSDQDLAWLDEIADCPERPVTDINPDWER
jgi:Transglutaminase-like superfamily